MSKKKERLREIRFLKSLKNNNTSSLKKRLKMYNFSFSSILKEYNNNVFVVLGQNRYLRGFFSYLFNYCNDDIVLNVINNKNFHSALRKQNIYYSTNMVIDLLKSKNINTYKYLECIINQNHIIDIACITESIRQNSIDCFNLIMSSHYTKVSYDELIYNCIATDELYYLHSISDKFQEVTCFKTVVLYTIAARKDLHFNYLLNYFITQNSNDIIELILYSIKNDNFFSFQKLINLDVLTDEDFDIINEHIKTQYNKKHYTEFFNIIKNLRFF